MLVAALAETAVKQKITDLAENHSSFPLSDLSKKKELVKAVVECRTEVVRLLQQQRRLQHWMTFRFSSSLYCLDALLKPAGSLLAGGREGGLALYPESTISITTQR